MVDDTPTSPADSAHGTPAAIGGGQPTEMADGGPFPGWYPDPLQLAAERFWNGREWTGNSRGEASSPRTVPSDPQAGSGGIVGNAPHDAAQSLPDQDGAGLETRSQNESTPPAPDAGRPRIFGAGVVAGVAEPTLVAVESAVPESKLATEPAASSEPLSGTPQGARVKSALQARVDTSLAPAASAVAPEPSPSATDYEPAMAEPPVGQQPTSGVSSPVEASGPAVRLPFDRPAAASPSPKKTSWIPLVLGSLVALAIGLGVGWFIGDRGQSEAASPTTSAAGQVTAGADTSTDNTEQSGDGARVTTDEAAADGAGDSAALAELQSQVEELTITLEEQAAESDALALQRDNEQAHNDLLQTWFTPEVQNRSERAWNTEVDRACQAADAPSTENTTFTRAMELTGTHADLVAAIEACQAAG